MNIIDRINEFENVGFSRKQAELQVRTMHELKKDLATKKDLENLESKMDVKFDRIDENFSLTNKRIDIVEAKLEGKIEALNIKMDVNLNSVNSKIDLLPLKTVIYMAGLLLMYMGLAQYSSLFKTWLFRQ